MAECFLPPMTGRPLLAIKAFGVDLEQHLYGVLCPLRDLGGWYATG